LNETPRRFRSSRPSQLMVKRTLTLLIAVAATAVAHAQVDPFDAHCANIGILQAKPIQKEIGLTEAQRTKLNVHADWLRQQVQSIEAEARVKKLTRNSPEVLQRQEQLSDELKSRCLRELQPAQVKRLREITLQQVGDAALCDPIVAKRVGLSDDQLKRMQATYREGAQKFSEIEQAAAQKVLLPYKDRHVNDKATAEKLQAEVRKKLDAAAAAVKPQLNAVRLDYAKRMKAILTSSQAKTYESLRGRRFSLG